MKNEELAGDNCESGAGKKNFSQSLGEHRENFV